MLSNDEILTARGETRLKFLEQDSNQSRGYRQDLECYLLLSKKILSEILSTKVIPNSMNLDHSADTENSHVHLKTFETALEENAQLFETLLQLRKQRDLTQSRCLIHKQIADEVYRSEKIVVAEFEELISEQRYAYEKKEQRLITIQMKISDLELALNNARDDKIIQLPLTVEGLFMHNHLERIKNKLSNASKKLQATEVCNEELLKYGNGLVSEIEKFKTLSRNPLTRTRKGAGVNSQNLEMSMAMESFKDSDSSEELIFPDKFSIEAKQKPNLPKLDLSRISKKIGVDISPVRAIANLSKIKNRIRDLENKCKYKTDQLQELRETMKLLEENKKKLIPKLTENEIPEILTERKVKLERTKRKRAMSNAIDYILVGEIKECSSELDLESSEISSFIVTTTNNFDEEPDSVLVNCISEISVKNK